MGKTSAGLLLYRKARTDLIEVLLVHPGGPYWRNKDEHGWSVPKGEYSDGEDPEAVARREFGEELGAPVPPGRWHDLGQFGQPSRKLIRVWAVKVDNNTPLAVHPSNTFEMEWPPRSGKMQHFPEVDAAEWWTLATARRKLHKAQLPLAEAMTEACVADPLGFLG